MNMSTVEIETGTYIKRFAFWNPATWSIPKLYWDAWSIEQRTHAICRQLEKVIAYADYIGVNVDDIAARLKAIEDGQLDELIEQKIEEWFEDNEPTIMQALEDLQTDIENITLEIGNGFDSENTIAMAIEGTNEDVSENTSKIEILTKNSYTEPNFKCVDRFIYGDWGLNDIDSAQAGCVFVQDNFTYWAQVMNSSSNGEDRIIIRNLETNTEIARLTGQFGHGYTISYNPTTKELLTQDVDSTPRTLIIIDVSNMTDVQVTQIIATPGMSIDNPCWYDATHFIAATGNNTWTVFDISTLEETDVYTIDLHGYAHNSEYIFQNMCWHSKTNEAYIGTTKPDGIIICDVDETEKKIVMKDFIACKSYYGYLYMRELEFAYRQDDKMYINQFDRIDGLMVVALLEWDMKNGTIPNENSKYVQPTGNIGFYIDYENGSLIQSASQSEPRYKLAGDAINEGKSIGGYSRLYLIFENDYPLVVEAKSTKIAILTSTAVTVKGFSFTSCDVYWTPSNQITVNPSINIEGTQYCGVYIYISDVKINSVNAKAVELDSSDSPASINPHGWYMQDSTLLDVHQTHTYESTDWFRWCQLCVASATSIANATVFNCSKLYRN